MSLAVLTIVSYCIGGPGNIMHLRMHFGPMKRTRRESVGVEIFIETVEVDRETDGVSVFEKRYIFIRYPSLLLVPSSAPRRRTVFYYSVGKKFK